jgi:hypothetical protein
MKGYKVFNPDWTCRGFKYEIGKTYEHDGNLSVCNSGFHFCKKAVDCFNYYSFDSDNKVAEVIARGEILTEEDKSCTNKIEIIREVAWSEVLEIVNMGKNNTGHSNAGDRNTGDWNTGDSNTGDRNTGYSNTGDRNTGYRNTGNWNTGDWNTGYSNTGDSNTGDWNTGDYNATNFSSGFFCTEEPKIKFFNEDSKMTRQEFFNSDAYSLLPPELTMDWFNRLTRAEKSVIEKIPNYTEEKIVALIKKIEEARRGR